MTAEEVWAPNDAAGAPVGGSTAMGGMILKERRTEQGLLVSVCDEDVLGETFENGDVSLTVEEDFYAGEAAEEVDPDAVVESLGRAAVANLVGTECVEVAVEAGLIDPGQVLEVDDTLHAQYLRF